MPSPTSARWYAVCTAALLAIPLTFASVSADALTNNTAVGQVADGEPTPVTANASGESSDAVSADGTGVGTDDDADYADGPDDTDGPDDAGGDEGSRSRQDDDDTAGAKEKVRLPGTEVGGVQGKARWYAMTWQSNELRSKDDAIYHCVRAGYLVGRAHIVKRGEAARFSCRYDKQTDWPYGVKVFQPAGRRVVVKVGTKKVQDYGRPDVGRDVWVVEGNPTGWWRTYIT